MTRISNKVFDFSVYLVVMTIVLPRSVNNFAIALFILSWLGSQGWKQFRELKINEVLPVLFSILLLFTYIISFLWTEDITNGIKVLEVLTPLLIFPVTLAVNKKAIISYEGIFKVFIFSVIIILLVNFAIAIARTLDYGFYYMDPDQTVIYNNFFYHGFASGTAIHPSFLALFAGFSIIILVNADNNDLKLTRRTRVLMTIPLIAGMILLQAITVTFATLIAIVIIVLLSLKRSNNRLGIYLSIVFIFIVVFSYITLVKLDWTKSIISYEFESYTGWNSVNLRLALWEAARQVISENIVLGVGIGDAEKSLLDKYNEMKFYFAALNNNQPHNQFLLTWLMTGISGVLATFLLFISIFRSAMQKQNYLYLALAIIFIIFCLTDIPLSRNKPLVFLMFFSFLFEFQSSSRKERALNHQKGV